MRLGSSHVGDKTIAATRNRHDVAVLRAAFAEGAPQRGDGLSEIILLDYCVRPDRPERLILLQPRPAAPPQIKQRLDRLGRQRPRPPAAPAQLPLGCIDAE